MGQKVVILGASDKPERYAWTAFNMLREYGHIPLPVSPTLKSIDGVAVSASLGEIKGAVDTLTMYVNPKISSRLRADILRLNPKRVIFTPGSENPELAKELKQVGIHTIDACTMVLLRTAQFETA